jgi:carboxypeptidase C (cathepsin A)
MGESYAGKYVPSIAYQIHQYNQNAPPTKRINLKGIAIGNGWVHPIVQNQAYIDYSYNLGLISEADRDSAQSIMTHLIDAIQTGQWRKANDLSNALEAVVLNAAGVEVDNVLFSKDPLEEIANSLQRFFDLPEVKAIIGTENFKRNWAFVNTTVESFFDDDEQQSVLSLLPTLIDNYRVLIYTGNMDLNCNVAGVERYIKEMKWSDYDDFYNQPRKQWYTNNHLSGYAQNWKNLTVVVIRNAGHEVPFYQPQAALDMLDHFLTGKSF